MRDFSFNFAGLIHRQLGGNAASLTYRGQVNFTAAGAYTFTATFPCIVYVYAWGGGCGGYAGGGGVGGSGGGACFRRFTLAIGQTITGSVGARGGSGTGLPGTPGGNTTVTGPGASMTANGGQSNTVVGTATGGELNRSGGLPTAAGQFGGAGGVTNVGNGGGGAGGFSDQVGPAPGDLQPGAGGNGFGVNSNGLPGGDPGGGGAGSGGSGFAGGQGGPGRVCIVILATG